MKISINECKLGISEFLKTNELHLKLHKNLHLKLFWYDAKFTKLYFLNFYRVKYFE